MVARSQIEIPVEGATLAAVLYTPENLAAPAPAITLANGMAGLKESLDSYATAFAEAGFVAVLHDHRNFGGSTGTHRHDIDPWQQIADWRRVISYLESREEVDASRIGLWGTSFAGGHALVLGATDRRLKAVVSQVPFISGREDFRRRVLPEAQAAWQERYDEDERGQLRGEPPRMIKMVDTDPGADALYHAPDIARAYIDKRPAGVEWSNEITLRSSRRTRIYEPGSYADLVSPTPLLMIVTDNDTMTPADLALGAYERALEPKSLLMLPGTHFTPYVDRFDESSTAALNWFASHLS
ncbi:alpha/beta fold hydrolase [Streptomyces sp. NPDC002133]|uniref:alpha/beta hydrolase n=1 Tax=Streptomyces sp. NPDC002133 TaxID=3154409 RepID=UPI0033278AB9